MRPLARLALLASLLALALWTPFALDRLDAAPEAAPLGAPETRVTDAGVASIVMPDSATFTALPERRVPDGTIVEVASGVWFIAPSGFVATRPDARSLQLAIPSVNIIVSVSAGARARALRPPPESIAAFAEHNGFAVVTSHPFGTDRHLAVLSGQDADGPREVTMMQMSAPDLRISVIVMSDGPRIGDPMVAELTDEAFHGRLLMP